MVKETKIRKVVANPTASQEKDCLMLLREWVGKQHHLPDGISDSDLLQYLHCTHYSVEQAKKVLDAYYTIRTNTEFFNQRDFVGEKFKEAIKSMYFFQFENTTPRGEKVLFFKLATPDVNLFDYVEVTRYGFATLDVYLEENNRQPGYQVIFDMESLALGHVLKVSAHLSLMKKELMYVQEALPFNLTGIHMLNTMPIVDTMMAMVKPMMNSELLDMMTFYKPEETHLIYDVIPQGILPKEYGGKAPSLEEQSEKARTKLVNAEKLIKFKETQLVNEARRLTSDFKNDSLGIQGCFKKLDLD